MLARFFARALVAPILVLGCSSADFSVAPDDDSGTIDAGSDAAVDGTVVDGGDVGVDGGTDGAKVDAPSDGTIGSEGGADAVSVDAVGIDAGPPGCTALTGCPSGQACVVTGCDATTTGTCVSLTGIANYAPSCGCDRVSYWSALTAANNGIRVRHSGPCDGVGEGLGCDPSCTFKCIHRHSSVAGCLTSSGQCWRFPDVPDLVCPPGGGPGIVAVTDCGDVTKCSRECDVIKTGSASFYPSTCSP